MLSGADQYFFSFVLSNFKMEKGSIKNVPCVACASFSLEAK
jgi:hypothetical protein